VWYRYVIKNIYARGCPYYKTGAMYNTSAPVFQERPPGTKDLRRRTEIIPVKDPHTRIKPLALASGHGRYITVTPERKLVSVEEWPLHIAVMHF
jgi:hypothetical protein